MKSEFLFSFFLNCCFVYFLIWFVYFSLFCLHFSFCKFHTCFRFFNFDSDEGTLLIILKLAFKISSFTRFPSSSGRTVSLLWLTLRFFNKQNWPISGGRCVNLFSDKSKVRRICASAFNLTGNSSSFRCDSFRMPVFDAVS